MKVEFVGIEGRAGGGDVWWEGVGIWMVGGCDGDVGGV